MAQWFDGYIPLNGASIHCVRTGGEKPPVVLLHGATDNAYCWTRTARVLEQDYDIIMVDDRGHGRSSWSKEYLTDDFQVDDVAALIQALKLDTPSIMGHSMGASTAARVAAKYPQLVRAIVLEDPVWRNDSPPPPDWAGMMTAMKMHTREELIEIGRRDHPKWDLADIEPWAESKLQLNPDRFNAPLLARVSWQEIAQKITCPTLIVTADPAQGAIVTPEVAREALEILPRGQTVCIDDAGHCIRYEEFPPYIEAVRAFLKEH